MLDSSLEPDDDSNDDDIDDDVDVDDDEIIDIGEPAAYYPPAREPVVDSHDDVMSELQHDSSPSAGVPMTSQLNGHENGEAGAPVTAACALTMQTSGDGQSSDVPPPSFNSNTSAAS